MSLITIRPAIAEDAFFVAPLIYEAMGELVSKFTKGNVQEGILLFEHFFRKENNQYSFQNCSIAQYNGEDAGMILTYDGKDLSVLRHSFLMYLESQYNFRINPIEDETQQGELYIDCLAVEPKFRGKRLGSALIKSAIDKAKTLKIPNTGLIVDIHNDIALRLYESLGF
ncbi:MAG: GNAT family N-acetyltransferase, partial [Pseudopedobacter saltans]